LLQVNLRALFHPWTQHRLRNNSRVQVVPDRAEREFTGVVGEVEIIRRGHCADLMRELAEGQRQVEDENLRRC